MTKANTGMNFDSLDTAAAAETPYEFELVHPANKKPLGVFVSVIGMASNSILHKFRQNENVNRRREFEAKRKNAPVEPKTSEEDEAETIGLVVDLMRGWRTVTDGKSEPVILWGAERLEFNGENAKRWVAHFPWTRLQIIEQAGEVGNFLKN